jgi:hypothetical protein
MDKFFEWLATGGIILGSILLSSGYPFISAISFFIGSISWTIVAILWKKKSLLINNGFIAFVYLVGFLREFLNGVI